MPRMLDLYAGLGGASQYFRSMGWEVHAFENNQLITDPESKHHVPGITHQDVLQWDYTKLPAGHYEFIWASPPCTEFSDALAAPATIARNEGREFHPDLTLLLKAKEIIDYFKPKWHCIENVRGARKIFTETLGSPPWQIVGPFFLWGKFPRVHLDFDWRHTKRSVDKSSTHPLRANHRGKLPLEISKAFYDEITSQTLITEW